MKPSLVANRQPNITLNYRDCGNKTLGDAIQKLAQFTGWKDSKDLHRFAKFKHQWDSNQKHAGIWYQKLLEKHCHMDPVLKDGKPVLGPDGKPRKRPRWEPNPLAQGAMDFSFRDKKAFEKDYKIMGEYEFTIKVYKWTVEELTQAGLTANELIGCAKLLDDPGEELLGDLEDISADDFQCPIEMDLIPPEDPAPETPAGEFAVQS